MMTTFDHLAELFAPAPAPAPRRTQVIDCDMDGFWILIDGFVRAIYWTEDGKRAPLADEIEVLQVYLELERERAEPEYEDENPGYWFD